MGIAYEAMIFARHVHRAQQRKYTGNMRTTPPETIELMSNLYASGIKVRDISEITGIPVSAIRNYVANHDLIRIESMFHIGAQLLADIGETFKIIPWAPSYFVSDFGRIIGMTLCQSGTILNPSSLPKSGYLMVKIVESDGVTRHNYIHRIVLRVFRGEPPNGMEGAHNDGDPGNNRLNNLRWDTHSRNDADKDIHGTRPIGSKHANSKINEETAEKIKSLLSSGKSQVDISRGLGVHISCIANIAQGKAWRHIKSPSTKIQ